MNLKNSKFFKRIQELRNLTKEKAKKNPDHRARTKRKINMAFAECVSGNDTEGDWETSTSPIAEEPVRLKWKPPCKRIKKGKTVKRKDRNEGGESINVKEPKTGKMGKSNKMSKLKEGGDFKGLTASDEIVSSSTTTATTTTTTTEDEPKFNGLIQLNNKCFRVACETQPRAPYKEHGPSISNAKSSICVGNSRYAMIGKISKSLGYKLVKETKLWNILWSDSFPTVELFKNMKRFQQINHFPGMIEICRKDLLSRNLNRMLKLYPHDYKIFPKTWMLPADYGDAMSFALLHKRTFILKPDSGAQGRGIWLTNDLKTIGPNERLICQTYIGKPLLIDGYKFDLRVYTLITSVDPLRIFVYNEGLARFATNKYVEPTPGNSHDLYMHLTNYSVNKRNSHYDLCDNDDCGSKRKLSAINNWMVRHNYDVDEFWANVDDVIIKTVMSAYPVLKHNYHACFPSHDKIQACFEILGFDILVDWKLKPYILEVNHSPSFHTNEQVDREVKRPLIRDTLSLVSTVLANKKEILREDRIRVKQRLLKNPHKGDLSQRNLNTTTKPPQQPPKTTEKSKTDDDEDVKHTLGSLAQQIAWEESHLGNFRRIMPPTDPNKVNYYCKFYGQTNQVSIFAETAASKKREDLAKKMRSQIEEKKARQLEIVKGRAKREEKFRKNRRILLPRSVREKQRLSLYRLQENWTPGFISEAEERLRRTWTHERNESIRGLKIMETIFTLFFNSGGLTSNDINTYPQLYSSLQHGFDITQEVTDCHH